MLGKESHGRLIFVPGNCCRIIVCTMMGKNPTMEKQFVKMSEFEEMAKPFGQRKKNKTFSERLTILYRNEWMVYGFEN